MSASVSPDQPLQVEDKEQIVATETIESNGDAQSSAGFGGRVAAEIANRDEEGEVYEPKVPIHLVGMTHLKLDHRGRGDTTVGVEVVERWHAVEAADPGCTRQVRDDFGMPLGGPREQLVVRVQFASSFMACRHPHVRSTVIVEPLLKALASENFGFVESDVDGVGYVARHARDVGAT